MIFSLSAAAGAFDHAKQQAVQTAEQAKVNVAAGVEATKEAASNVADAAAAKVHEGSQVVGEKVDEARASADAASKNAAQAAIDKSREVNDASHAKVEAGLDKAEAHVQDDRSFVQQAKDGVAGVMSGVKSAIFGAAPAEGDVAVKAENIPPAVWVWRDVSFVLPSTHQRSDRMEYRNFSPRFFFWDSLWVVLEFCVCVIRLNGHYWSHFFSDYGEVFIV